MANRKDKDNAGAGTATAEQPDNTEAATAAANTGQALTTSAAPQTLATDNSQYVDHTLLHSEVAIAEAIEAARAMEMSFVTYTKPEQVFALSQEGARFMITDVVTVNINDPENRNGTGQKAVHVFKLETIGEPQDGGGMEYFTMFGTNPVRDRIADGFFKNRLLGIRMTAGPIKIGQVKVQKWPSPAWTFESVKGFRIARV